MKLTVLGGSAAGPNTGQGCSGYLVEVADTRLVLDLGPGTLLELRRHTDFRILDAIVVSHLHLDHVLDLLALRFALAYNPVPPPRRTPLWLPPGGLAWLARAAAGFAAPGEEADFFAGVFAAAEYDPAAMLTIGAARLSFAPTVHYVPCWAIRVAGPERGADLAYTADTGPAADLAPFVQGARTLVAEATLLEPSAEPFATRGHLTAAEAGELATAASVRTLLLAHIWEELGQSAARTAAAETFSGYIDVAYPGLALAW